MKKIVGLIVLAMLVSCADESSDSVSVERGEANQPSIRVDTAANPQEADRKAIEMQGYLEAKDRLVQMDLLRRYTGGRLAELFEETRRDPDGVPALEKDLLVRASGIPYAAEKSLEKLKKDHPEAYGLLQAFSDGVNRFIAEIQTLKPEWVRYYRTITGDPNYLPAPWVPLDSLTIATGASFHLSSSLVEKAALGQIASILTEKEFLDGMLALGDPQADFTKVLQAFDLRPVEDEFIIGSFPKWVQSTSTSNQPLFMQLKGQPRKVNLGCTEIGYPFGSCGRMSAFGSNNWVVSREFAGGNSVFLANDPHLPLRYPSAFYEVAINSKKAGGTFRVRGMNLTGVPGVLIGHNDDIAWGMTNVGADVDDVYLETLNDEGTATLYQGAWEPLLVKNEVLRIRNKKGEVREESFPFRYSKRHGFIFSDYQADAKQILKFVHNVSEGKHKLAYAYKWVGHEGSTEVAAIMGVNRAGYFAEFKQALSHFGVGAQNIIYGDRKGNIGYVANGKYPVRKYLSLRRPPYLPLPGQGGFEWEPEFRANIPQAYNPPTGRIVTANNDPFGHSRNPNLSNLTDYFGAGFSTGLRAKRITALLEENKGKLSMEKMREIQFDHVDLLAGKLIQLAVEGESEAGYSSVATETLATLKKWNLKLSRDSEEAVLYGIWLNEAKRELLKQMKLNDPGLTQLSNALMGSHVTAKTLFHKLTDGLKSPLLRPQSLTFLSDTLDRAGNRLNNEGLLGSRWGEWQKVHFKNELEGLLPSLIFAPIERDGGEDTVDVAGENIGPNFRLTIAISDEGFKAMNVVPGGNFDPSQTKELFHELMMWREGQGRELVSFH